MTAAMVSAPARRPQQSIRQVRVEHLVQHAHGRDQDPERVAEMAASMRELGILQPLIVTEHPTELDRWLILDGGYRLSAARLAGRTRVPCIVRHNLDEDLDDQLVVMLTSNCQRVTMTAIDRAERYGVLRKRGLLIAEIARRVGIVESAVSNALRLLELDTETRERVRRGELTAKAAGEIVVEVRQERRVARGQKPNGRPRATEPAYFTAKHPLAEAVREVCGHHRRPSVGGVGCGQCWEAAIRDAVTTPPAPETEFDYDEVVVVRRLSGDRSGVIRPVDKVEIVRRAREQGWSFSRIERVCGFTKPDRYLRLPAGGVDQVDQVDGRELRGGEAA